MMTSPCCEGFLVAVDRFALVSLFPSLMLRGELFNLTHSNYQIMVFLLVYKESKRNKTVKLYI